MQLTIGTQNQHPKAILDGEWIGICTLLCSNRFHNFFKKHWVRTEDLWILVWVLLSTLDWTCFEVLF